jgi:hypothetical protein
MYSRVVGVEVITKLESRVKTDPSLVAVAEGREIWVVMGVAVAGVVEMDCVEIAVAAVVPRVE